MITPNFSREEMEYSSTALRLGINNKLPDIYTKNMLATCLVLEGIRACISKKTNRVVPVVVTSGYRCPVLNAVIGSSSTSDHTVACAADIKSPLFGPPGYLAEFLVDKMDALGIGQLIYEHGSWVHVSIRKPANPINRILTINSAGTHVGIIK